MIRFIVRLAWTGVALATVLGQAPSFWRASASAYDRLNAKWKRDRYYVWEDNTDRLTNEEMQAFINELTPKAVVPKEDDNG